MACISAGRAEDGFEPLSPQNSTGNRILRASNDNLASVAFELGRANRVDATVQEGKDGGGREREG